MSELYTKISSRNTITNLWTYLAKMAFIRHWNVAGAFVGPNGMTLKWKWLWCVLKVIFSSSPSRMWIWWYHARKSVLEKYAA